jgi:glutamate carboxypeptidase
LSNLTITVAPSGSQNVTTPTPSGRIVSLQDFVDAVRALVTVESPSSDPAALREAQRVLAEVGHEIVGVKPWHHDGDFGPGSISWRCGEPDDPRRVLLLGHVDTVWPLGTAAERPFSVQDGRASGPGVFDMKAGLVIGLHVLAALGDDAPVTLLVTGDEEVGSAASKDVIESAARSSQACLVLEGAGPHGALKSARKGWSFYTLEFAGRAAHAGLEPEKGISVLPAVSGMIARIIELDSPSSGVSVNPTTVRAGTTVNTIPAHGELAVDVRCTTEAQQGAVDRQVRDLARDVAGDVHIEVRGGINRPPMPSAGARPLLERLGSVQSGRRRRMPDAVTVGGISDANLTAALGVPTLDGLGAVGGGAHAEHEWIDLEQTRERVPMIAALVHDLIDSPLGHCVTAHDWRDK